MSKGAPAGLVFLIKWLSFSITAVSFIIAVRAFPIDQGVAAMQSWLRGLGSLGPVILALVYVLATVLFVPASILTIAAGALFGLWVGTVTVSLGSTAGAGLAFLIARYLARAKVEQMISGRPKMAALDHAINDGGWRIVALLRLSPAVPFNVQNYFYGLTAIRFWPYLVTSWIAMLPGTFLYVYIGQVTGAVVAGNRSRSPFEWAALGVGLVATAAVTVYVTRLAQRQLRTYAPVTAPSAPSVSAPSTSPASTRTAVIAFVIAVAAVAGATYVHGHSDRIAKKVSSMFGPPHATLKEAYEETPNGVRFDHSAFDRVLKGHVSEGGWVDYAGLETDRAELKQYITSLGNASFELLGRDEKLALLINAYNAFTLELILEHYPIHSIKDIPSAQRWDDKRWKIGANTWSLNQIEQEQIRPKFKEPRVHFALVCAAIGCPPLRNEAYTGTRIEEQLEDQARNVHGNGRWFRYTPGGNLFLTHLYDWYGGDFEQVAGSVLDFASRYSTILLQDLKSGHKPIIQWLDYNWTLNDIANRPE